MLLTSLIAIYDIRTFPENQGKGKIVPGSTSNWLGGVIAIRVKSTNLLSERRMYAHAIHGLPC